MPATGTPTPQPYVIHIGVAPAGNRWSAQCFEADVTGNGDSSHDALSSLRDALGETIASHNGNLLVIGTPRRHAIDAHRTELVVEATVFPDLSDPSQAKAFAGAIEAADEGWTDFAKEEGWKLYPIITAGARAP